MKFKDENGGEWYESDASRGCLNAVIKVIEKVKKPGPTPEDCMRHLLAGGIIVWPEYSNADYFIRLRAGVIEFRFKRHDSDAESWKPYSQYNYAWFLGADADKARLIWERK